MDKTTLITAAVSAALSTGFATGLSSVASAATLSAPATLPALASLPSYDQFAQTARQQQPQAMVKSIHQRANLSASKKANTAATANLNGSGIYLAAKGDHFDNSLNTHTFSWAKGAQKTAAIPYSVFNRGSAIEQATRGYVNAMGAKHGVSASGFKQAELKYVSDNKRGSIISKYQQKVNDIEVYGRQLNVLLNQNMELVATSGYFANLPAPQKTLVDQFTLSAEEAISKAFNNITGDAVKLSLLDKKANYQRFKASSDNYAFSEQPRGKKVYYPGRKTLIPAYYVEVMISEKNSKDLIAYSHVISAVDGQVLNRTNLVQRDTFTYKTFADSTAPFTPFDNPMGNALTPHPSGVFNDKVTEVPAAMNDVTLEHSGISTSDPWLPTGATVTTGNNVDAYADLSAPDGFNEGDIRPTTTSANTFGYVFTHDDRVNSNENINAATVNLFYVNNYLHDLYYNHGFDEVAGVAQTDNFGRGGIDGDVLRAEAQDYSGVNNATMATPADGASPRMHMFLWQTDTIRDGTVDNAIVEHEWGHYISSRLTGGGMYANNQGASMGEGWGDFFALMTMAREADQQLVGNDQWQAPYNDGGYAVNNGFVEFAYFFGLRRAPYSTNMEHNAFTFKHIQDQVKVPTTHPISNLYQADFHMDGALNSEVHNSGEIWALMLWESYTAMLNRDGVSFSEAQSRMMDYMVASMKMTPFAPTFTEARDALLAVAMATDAADHQVIRAAFAKRGMGLTAQSPERFDAGFDGTFESRGHAGTVESFEAFGRAVALDSIVLDNRYNGTHGAFCDTDNILDVGETGLLTVSINNTGTELLSGIKAKLTSDSDITFANDGMIDFADLAQWRDTTSGTIEATLNSGDTNDTVIITVTLMSDDAEVILSKPMTASLNVNFDLSNDREIEDFEDSVNVWSGWQRTRQVDSEEDPEHFLSQWGVFDDVDFGNVGFGPNLSQQNDISLVTPEVTVAASGDFAVQFEHYYDFERGDPNNPDDTTPWDGGVMEISIDGGEWTDVVAAGGSFLNGYNGNITDFNPELPGRAGFIGIIESLWISPESLTFAAGSLNNKSVKFRFRIGSDGSVASWGWNIDNFRFTNATVQTPFPSLGANVGACVNREPVVTNVEGPASTNGGGEVTLTANAVDHDNSTLTYQWTQTGGSSAIDVSTTSATLTFKAPEGSSDEVYSFSVTAFDGELLSRSSEFSIMVIINQAPTVTTEQGITSVKEQQALTLMVNGTDANGDDITYQWMIDGELIANTASTFEYVAPAVSQDKEVVFSVTASDGTATSEAIQMVVTVIANQVPVVTTTQQQVSVKERGSVMLAVSATDPENDRLSYQWQANGIDLANNSSSLNYTAASVSADTLITFSVTANDGDETSQPVEIALTVVANRAPVVSTEQAQISIREKTSTTLAVMAVDPENDALTYQWTMDGEALDNNSAWYDFTAPGLTQDKVVVFSVVATDGDETSEAVTMAVTVLANRAPIVTVDQAFVSVKEKESVMLSVSAVDPENDAFAYRWTKDGVLLDHASVSLNFTAPAVSQDTTVVFAVTASDGDATSSASQIVVEIVANVAPVVTAAQPNVVIREGEDVMLAVVATDAENDSLTYRWTKDGATLTETGASMSFTGPEVSTDTTVVFSVTAFDGDEVSAATQINVTVENRSSGGALGLWGLLLAPLAFIRRRRNR